MNTTATIQDAPLFSRAVWARVAGFVYLFYIVNGIVSMAVPRAIGRPLGQLTVLDAIVLATALFALTYRVSPWLAGIAFLFRAFEGFAPRLLDPVTATLVFAAGSTIFAWLLLNGRLIPRALAWLGIGASLLLFVALPIAGASWSSPWTWSAWIPMLVYEVASGCYLLVKGVRA